jgi:hypothetical protein
MIGCSGHCKRGPYKRLRWGEVDLIRAMVDRGDTTEQILDTFEDRPRATVMYHIDKRRRENEMMAEVDTMEFDCY